MEYQILVDENTSPRVAASLRDAGITAEHVHAVLSEGVDDATITAYAPENDAIVLTHDSDFLDPETRAGVSVLYYADDTMDSSEIADCVMTLIEWVPSPGDVPPLTNLHKLDKADATGLDPVEEAGIQCLKSQYGSRLTPRV